jgi:hypothetical protein
MSEQGAGSAPRRPWRARVWFWKPSWYWHGWKTLVPFFTGGDEFDWHTVCLGWTITGRVIIATRPCPRTGRCADAGPLATWPVDAYGWDWSNGKPTVEDLERLDHTHATPPSRGEAVRDEEAGT